MNTTLRRLLVITINVVVLIGLLALLEFGVRWIQARRLGPRAYEPASHMDRWTAWRNAPDYDRGDIRHNHQGFRRDEDVGLEKPANTVRIFFLGGSTAVGCEGLFRDLDPEWQKLYNRDLIDVYLQQKLQDRHPERRWEVINGATSEFRMHQHLMLIFARLLLYKPNMAIFLDGHNDMSGIMGNDQQVYDPYAATPHGEEFQSMVYPRSLRSLLFINAAWLRNNSVLFAGMQRRVISAVRDDEFGVALDRGQPVPVPVEFQDLQPALQKRARGNLARQVYYTEMAERLHNALAHAGVLSLFSMQPELILSGKPPTAAEAKFASHFRAISGRYATYMWENLQPLIARAMAESARRKGYTFVDLRYVYQNVREKTFTDYCHLTPKGNQLVAEQLYSAMAGDIPKLIASTAAPSGRGQ